MDTFESFLPNFLDDDYFFFDCFCDLLFYLLLYLLSYGFDDVFVISLDLEYVEFDIFLVS